MNADTSCKDDVGKSHDARSSALLAPEEHVRRRAGGERLAFDPVQIGRVPRDVVDDIDTDHAPPKAGWPSIEEAVRRAQETAFSLRAWRASDAALFRTLLDDVEVWRYMPQPQPHPGPLTEDMARDLIALSNEESHHQVRAILFDGVPVGQVRLEYLEGRSVEVSYWLGRAVWGRGIAGAVVPRFVDSAASSGRFDRVIARVHRLNLASQRILARAGLRPAGPLPGSEDWLLFERTV